MDPTGGATKIPLRFYRTSAGNEPVRDWLRALDPDARLAIGQDLLRVQYRWPVGMPLCRALGNGLWEVRTRLPGGTASRVLMCFEDGMLVALSGFIKKTQKTPTENCSSRSDARRMLKMANKHIGSTIDDFLADEGVLQEFQAKAIKEVVAWQLSEAMKARKLSKRKLATLMHTSRTQIDRVLDPENGNVTLETLQRAAAILGRKVLVELV